MTREDVSLEIQRNGFLPERLAWLLFCAASVYVVFFPGPRITIPGESASLFPGLLCTLALMTAVLFFNRQSVRVSVPAIVISVGFLVLAIMSGLWSAVPVSSSTRGFVLVASGLGGFWCAKLLVNGPWRFRAFTWLSLGILAGMLVAALVGYFVYGFWLRLLWTMFNIEHQFVNLAVLLLFAPLALIGSRAPVGIIVGLLLICVTVGTLYLVGATVHIESAVLIVPPVLLVPVYAVRHRKNVVAALILLILASGLTAHYVSYVSTEEFSDKKYAGHRIEAYPFSWHVAKKHPFLGIGIWAPREHYVSDYTIHHPALTAQQLEDSLRRIVLPDNTFLSIMADLGMPFFFMYLFVLAVLLFRLIRLVIRPSKGMYFHPLTLLVPLSASILHSFVWTTLYCPHICWFFHVLLGLIPERADIPAATHFDWKRFGIRSAGAVAAITVGIVIGTLPVLAPENLSKRIDLEAYLKTLPVISLLYADKQTASPLTKELRSREVGGVPRSQMSEEKPQPPGSLIVKIDEVEPRWAIVFILDNSEAMAMPQGPWKPSRLDEAVGFIQDLSKSLPTGSRIAIRGFIGGVSLKMKDREIAVRVSRLLNEWTAAPFKGLLKGFERAGARGRNHLCAAAAQSIRWDFSSLGDLSPRIVLLTDGGGRCEVRDVLEAIGTDKEKAVPRVDVIGLGMAPGSKGTFRILTEKTNGVFLEASNPTDIDSALSRYREVLLAPQSVPATIEISDAKLAQHTVTGKEITLPGGTYSVWLPDKLHLSQSSRVIHDVKVHSEKTTVLKIIMKSGQTIVTTVVR